MQPEAGRNAVLEHFEDDFAVARRDAFGFVVVMRIVMVVTMAVPMPVIAAAQQPDAGDIDSKPEYGDRDRLGEMDLHRREQAADRLVADQQRDHRQDKRARKAGEIAEFAGAEGEARIVGVATREGVSDRGEQERAGVRAHMQSVGDQRDRAEQPPPDDLGQHHGRAENDNRPGLALARLVPFAEEHMAMKGGAGVAFFVHLKPHLR